MLARLHLPGMALATPAKEFETPAFDLPAMEPPRLGLPRFRVPTFALPRPFAPKPLISRRAMALGGLLLAAGAAVAVAGWALVRRHLLPPAVARMVTAVRSRIRQPRDLIVAPIQAVTTVAADAPDPDALFVESGEPC